MTEPTEAQPDACRNCRFFALYSQELGECRKAAPKLALDTQSMEGQWPRVTTGDFCGDFKR